MNNQKGFIVIVLILLMIGFIFIFEKGENRRQKLRQERVMYISECIDKGRDIETCEKIFDGNKHNR